MPASQEHQTRQFLLLAQTMRRFFNALAVFAATATVAGLAIILLEAAAR